MATNKAPVGVAFYKIAKKQIECINKYSALEHQQTEGYRGQICIAMVSQD